MIFILIFLAGGVGAHGIFMIGSKKHPPYGWMQR